MGKLKKLLMHWCFQTSVAIDQLFNAIFLGYADETLSSRTYRNARESKTWRVLEIIIDSIFFWQDFHCEIAYYTELHGGHNHEDLK